MPTDVLVLPAVNCTVIRVFIHDHDWYIADSHNVERICMVRTQVCNELHCTHGIGEGGPLGQKFQICLATHCKRPLWKYISDLYEHRVWFFGLYDDPPSAIFLWTCAVIPQQTVFMVSEVAIDMDFSLHQHLAPCIPFHARISLGIRVCDRSCPASMPNLIFMMPPVGCTILRRFPTPVRMMGVGSFETKPKTPGDDHVHQPLHYVCHSCINTGRRFLDSIAAKQTIHLGVLDHAYR